MKRSDIELKKVEVTNYSIRENRASLRVYLLVNGNEKVFAREDEISDVPRLVNNIILDIKQKETHKIESEDILESIFTLNFINQEDAEEKLVHFFNRLKDEAKSFKNTKTADNYMNMYHNLGTHKREIKL